MSYRGFLEQESNTAVLIFVILISIVFLLLGCVLAARVEGLRCVAHRRAIKRQ
jgi:uncharacterized integral membrane protein